MTAIRIGVDLGGTKIAGIALDASDATVAQCRMPAPREDYEASLDAIADTVKDLVRQAGVRGTVGIGMPGSLCRQTGAVQNANSTWLNGTTFKQDLEIRLKAPVRLANDANCLALSEAADGAGANAHSVFGAIIGTGCGGGLVYRVRVIEGRHRIGGEWGHNPLPWPEPAEYPGPPCWCGRNGCLETWVSGTGLEQDHLRVAGMHLSGEDIAREAAAGDAAARASLARHVGRLARGLAHVVNIFDPDVIVLGGGLSNMSHLYDELPGAMCQHMFADSPRPVVRPPVHGDASGVRGAARLWD